MTAGSDARQLSSEELEAGLEHIRRSPKREGVLEMIVRRPEVNAREVLQEARLDTVEGLVGDSWKLRGSHRTTDGSPHPDTQVNIMNARVIGLIATDRSRWPLAGDQLFVDFDLSKENLPTGSRLAIGSAIVEVTALAHTGCKKFTARYGLPAVKFVNSRVGKQLRLRGLNAKVLEGGVIRPGDLIRKLP